MYNLAWNGTKSTNDAFIIFIYSGWRRVFLKHIFFSNWYRKPLKHPALVDVKWI
jgi:hypothetical protein